MLKVRLSLLKSEKRTLVVRVIKKITLNEPEFGIEGLSDSEDPVFQTREV